ncbi:thiol-disulfide oxidoreductase [Nonlabens arenilitoris]|uniref:Thiol-disulfide oxidoreductase n=1 Tax=Nonlabens arenilitoris TaxID=1217969 RepID=A0A2S7UE83_9FLAO|nr:DCC1-like thiol-disulfide oxidoreductase family protein [Nonlabens arenilitoris]PQJ32593.1 thiol-disulfide oxidoreductase [Nonlabens arenilitoris]
MKNKQNDVILFDGVCNLCNDAVTFIIKRDSKNHFRFAALESDIGLLYLKKHQINPKEIDSIVLIRGERAYVKASAALRIAQKMDGFWPLLSALIIIPRLISNAIYEYIARNRYKWFGKQESCMIPTKDLRDKFLHK